MQEPIEQTTEATTPDIQPGAPSEPQLSEEEQHRESMGEVWEKFQREGVEAEAGDEEAEAVDRDEKGRFKPRQQADEVEDAQEVDQPEGTDDRPRNFTALPREIRDSWDEIPEQVRSRLASFHQEVANEKANLTRLEKGLGPLRDALQVATQQAPELANLSPQEAAREIAELAVTKVQLQKDPVGTLLNVAQVTGAMDGLRRALGGQGQQQGQQAAQMGQPQTQREAALMQQIGQMNRRLEEMGQQMQRVADPDTITGTVEQTLQMRDLQNEVASWAGEKPYYNALEPHLPGFIDEAIASLGNGASAKDILDAAYDMALERFNLPSAAQQTPQTAPFGQGQRTETARKANSANVRSRGTKPTELSERDAMGQAWERAMKA